VSSETTTIGRSPLAVSLLAFQIEELQKRLVLDKVGINSILLLFLLDLAFVALRTDISFVCLRILYN
jgi:hypothetical protein